MNSIPHLLGEICQSSQSSSTKKSGLILQEMTPEQRVNLKKQYMIWTEHAIIQMQTNATNNVTQRIPIMLGVANDNLKQKTNLKLCITDAEHKDILNKVHNEIATWNGIQIGTCKAEKDQYSDYSNTARNWFNRNKAKIYGNHLFHTIIFVKTYQFLLRLSGVTNTEKIALFLDILDGILHSTVQFKRSKAHPLIPHQTFIQPNMFRRACSNLCHYYEVNWDLSVTRHKRRLLPNGQYAKNRDRSRNINNAFIRKIEEIKLNVLCRNIRKALPVFNHQFDANCRTILSLHTDINNTNPLNHSVPKQESHQIQTAKTEAQVPSFEAAYATNSGSKYEANDINNINNNNNTNSSDNYRNIHLHSVDDSLNNMILGTSAAALHPFTSNRTTPLSTSALTQTNMCVTPMYVQFNNMNTFNNVNVPTIIAPPVIPISFPINQQTYTTRQLLSLLNNGVNCMQYTANHGQNNIVSQSRYSPLSTPNRNISLHQNIDGTFRISLDNIHQPQVMQLISSNQLKSLMY